MQTRCPHCQTTFRVSEAQLNAAKGKVRCGKCQQVFNAREYIHPVAATPTVSPEAPKKSSPTPVPQVDWLQQEDQTEIEHIELGSSTSSSADIDISQTATEQYDEQGVTEDEVASTREAATEPLDEPFTPADEIEFSRETMDADEDVEPETSVEAAAVAAEDDLAQDEGPAEIATDSFSEDSLIPGGLSEPLQDIEKDLTLPGIAPAYEDDSYLNAREEQGLSSLHDEIQRQLASPHEEDDNADATDAYDSVLDYLEDVKAQPSKTTAFEKIEIPPVPEEPSNAVNWDDAVHLDPEVPAALRSSMQALEKKKKRSTLLTAFMGLMLFVLIADLGVQTIIFRSYDIATKWPQSRELLTTACNYLPCVYSGRREPRKIQLVSRDVRVHPKAKHALLISATLVNQAGYAQPYPRLAVKLSDLSGDVVAEREFLPQEYLKASESRLKLLRPDVPTLITLEVLDPGSEAVNFEFRFL